ncbi:hypothetical protein SAMN04487765_2393 [Tenacibaculum sp. MAR_2010_89]|nr:hypothetical protein SAMN04487765_2393 [Tenacibaculum sp. MAR_2010_89]
MGVLFFYKYSINFKLTFLTLSITLINAFMILR